MAGGNFLRICGFRAGRHHVACTDTWYPRKHPQTLPLIVLRMALQVRLVDHPLLHPSLTYPLSQAQMDRHGSLQTAQLLRCHRSESRGSAKPSLCQRTSCTPSSYISYVDVLSPCSDVAPPAAARHLSSPSQPHQYGPPARPPILSK